jgi:general secretion pathway protein G
LFAKQIYPAFVALRDSFDVMCFNTKSSARSGGTIVLKEGGDLLGSYLDLVAAGVSASALASGNATDGAEAVKIINDLRNLKSASLLYYGDNLEWPTQGDIEELDDYMDRPLVSSGRYEQVIIGDEYKDDSGNTRVNVGFRLSQNTATPGIRKKLESRAEETGILSGSDSMAPYKGDLSVFINMR